VTDTLSSTDINSRLQQFLVREAAYLDDREYGRWLDLLHDDFLYRIPVPTSREDVTLSPYDEVMEYANESKSFLQMRFSRVTNDYAWAERPVAFNRHFVSNLLVLDSSEPSKGRWDVTTNVLVVRSRLPEPPVLTSAKRHDAILEVDGEFRLLQRTVYLDTEVPNESQLGGIY
jgi:3-phenylpropionate/cinnamic acid dioxygenase small subunit